MDDKKRRKIILNVSTAMIIVALLLVIVAFDTIKNPYKDVLIEFVTVQSADDEKIENIPPKNAIKETTTKETIKEVEETTKKEKKEKNRKLNIDIELPLDGAVLDKMNILVNNKVVSTTDVQIDGGKIHFTTTQKYKGDANVEVVLLNYKSKISTVVDAKEDSANLVLPLNRTENSVIHDDL